MRHYWARVGAKGEDQEDVETFTGHWLDPIIGLNGRFSFVDDTVYLPFHADVGGIGYGSEITWMGYGGVGVALGGIDIEAGYRALYADFRGDELDYGLMQAGPTLMTRFRF